MLSHVLINPCGYVDKQQTSNLFHLLSFSGTFTACWSSSLGPSRRSYEGCSSRRQGCELEIQVGRRQNRRCALEESVVHDLVLCKYAHWKSLFTKFGGPQFHPLRSTVCTEYLTAHQPWSTITSANPLV